ncbi:ABC transporter permease [Devosia sp. Root685]|uniref:ABC transporter permease n=1 Tax=Devosia sp. Root685 TaxID=1736587 RepID=UPI0006FBDE99|nr:ABC transporter permease [Devosia sp. Root685]KRA98010.1 ABC transporter permease [Devosia sp. Root685]
MLALIGQRLVNSLAILLVSTFVVFTLVALAGDPLGELRDRQPPVPDNVIAAEEARLGLDQPIPLRYVTWLTGVVQGDFGPSVKPNQNIGAELAPRVGVTLRLVTTAIVIATLLALIAGTVAALYRNRIADHLISTSAFILIALPSFWLAVLLKQGGIALNKAANARILFTIGDVSVPAPKDFLPLMLDMAGHLILPTIVLTMIHFASWSRYQRTAVVESLSSDHVRFAVLRGLSRNRIVGAHVMRPALIPIVTVVALDLPALLSGAVITETVFQWRGMGGFLLESIANRDANAVMAWLLVAAAAVVFFNLLADIVYAIVDPRVRYGQA